MRCPHCGWLVTSGPCPCGASRPGKQPGMVPVGTRVLSRPGRGPSMGRWAPGEILDHLGPLHQVRTAIGDYWCELDDLLPESGDRMLTLEEGARVWALFPDGRWYPATVDGCQGPLRHVTWDDGDAMWLDALHMVALALEPGPPQVDTVAVAPRWDGEFQPARVEQQEGRRFRVVFLSDGEEAWVPGEDLRTFPLNPFQD